jgi:hypothetical protein
MDFRRFKYHLHQVKTVCVWPGYDFSNPLHVLRAVDEIRLHLVLASESGELAEREKPQTHSAVLLRKFSQGCGSDLDVSILKLPGS